jgi:cytoskeletal protein RodZ
MKLHLIMFLAWLLWVTLWILKEVQAANRRRDEERRRKGA